MTDPFPQRRYIWGRRQSRPLKDNQRKALDELWPQISLELPENSLVDLAGLFVSPPEDIWLEIGFGGGEHLAAQAALHPSIGFIGCEPFVNGVASLLVHIQEIGLTNIRVVRDDARLLVARIPDQSVGRIFVLFPDPWPKKRHNKRRIIEKEMVTAFARILKSDGALFMATDDEAYAYWMQAVMEDDPAYELDLGGRKDVYERPDNWPNTRYEQKGISQGRASVYLVYKKKFLNTF